MFTNSSNMQETLIVCLCIWVLELKLDRDLILQLTRNYKNLKSEQQTCKSWEIAFGFLACFKSSLSLTTLPLLEIGTQKLAKQRVEDTKRFLKDFPKEPIEHIAIRTAFDGRPKDKNAKQGHIKCWCLTNLLLVINIFQITPALE